MMKKYFVTYAVSYPHININSTDVEIYVDENMTPGIIAQNLEKAVSEIYDDSFVTIINYWET